MTEQRPTRPWQDRRRLGRMLLITALVLVLVSAGPFAWTRLTAAGHLYDEVDLTGATGLTADVVIVLGAQVAPGGGRPMPFLSGRLDTAAQLVLDRRATLILVSGDANGGSGNETDVMTTYLTVERGIDSRRIITDSDGLDTYDSCLRAKRVYGIDRALVVTQSYHLARAVALCRHVGIDADGVAARCDNCRSMTLARNAIRDYAACAKAGLDAARNRPPGIETAPTSAVTDALQQWKEGSDGDD